MRLVFWFVVSFILLTLTTQGIAQDSLTFNTTPLTLTPSSVIDVSSPFRWRLSGALGYHRQIQNEPLYMSLYLINGFQATVAADYFFGQNMGLGLLIGYQNLVVNDDYKKDPSIPILDPYTPSTFSQITNFHSFMLAAGPAFSVPLGQRVTFDLDLRVGGFYNDSPTVKAYYRQLASATITPSLTVLPSDQRFRLGFIGSIGLKYQFTQQLGVGISGKVNYTSFSYNQIRDSEYTQNRVNLNMYGVQATISYRFLSSARQRSTTPTGASAIAAVVTPKPACYPPIIDSNQPNEYEVGSVRRPVIRWRSSAPIYTEGEQYVFRLYTLPGNKLLYEQTVREPQITWPTQLALPDTASYYFYSLYTSRSDDLEQTCRSEPVVGTLGFFGRQASAPTQTAAPREPAYAFTLRLYELQPTLILQKAPKKVVTVKLAKGSSKVARSGRDRQTKSTKPTATAKPIIPPVDSVRTDSTRLAVAQPDSAQARSMATDSARSLSTTADSTRSRLAPVDSTQADSMITSMRIVPNLLHEEPTPQSSFSWPGAVPLPSQPTVYQYTIIRNSNRELMHSQYVMVEPDGCSIIISDSMKNKHLRNSIPPNTKPVLESTQPTNKGKP